MKRVGWFLICLLAVNSAFGATTTREADEICKDADMFGIIEVTCWGYTECVNGVYVEHRCPDKQFFDDNTHSCQHNEIRDCYEINDCRGIPDAMYADVNDACKAYYRCFQEINLGMFYCPANHFHTDNSISAPVSSNRAHKENLRTVRELRSTGEDPISTPESSTLGVLPLASTELFSCDPNPKQ